MSNNTKPDPSFSPLEATVIACLILALAFYAIKFGGVL